jgi:hypothetical protein
MWLDGNYYAGGGGGGRNNAFCTSIRCETARIARGGLGGGGNGGIKFEDNQPATPGQPNTGGGGGGDGTGYSGGSGVIIFRYGSNYLTSGSIIGGDYIYTSDGYTYHKFLNVTTSSFNITFPQ